MNTKVLSALRMRRSGHRLAVGATMIASVLSIACSDSSEDRIGVQGGDLKAVSSLGSVEAASVPVEAAPTARLRPSTVAIEGPRATARVSAEARPVAYTFAPAEASARNVRAEMVIDRGDGPVAVAPSPITVTRDVPAVARDKTRREKEAYAERAPVDPSASALERLEHMRPDERVRVTFALDEPAFDWAPLRDSPDDQRRAEAIEVRKEVVAASQAPVIEWLTAHDGIDITPMWLANQVTATVPVGRAREALDLPEVVSIHVGHDVLTTQYTGLESTDGMLVKSPAFTNLNLTGHKGNRVNGGDIRLGIIEAGGLTNWIDVDHVGWQDWANGPTKIVRQWNCNGAVCAVLGKDNGSNLHGTIVSWIAAGSVEQGQDVNIVDGQERRRRSGHLAEGLIYYYSTGNTDHLANAIQRAVTDGVDIINMSFVAPLCNPTDNWSNLNTVMPNAVNAGVVLVAAAGNDGGNGCTIGYPAFRTETLAAAALNSVDATVAYDALGIAPFSARGGVPVRRFDGFIANWTTTPGVDLSTPGCFTHYFGGGFNNYGRSRSCGTSNAAPALTGAVGVMRHAFSTIGWTTTDAWALMVNMMLTGDSWDANTNLDRPTHLSDRSGAGRVRMHAPVAGDLRGPWGWGWRSFTIHQGETVKWSVGGPGPESHQITEWRWAALWQESDLNSVADIDFYVVDTCAPGGAKLVAIDASSHLRNRMRLKQSQIGGRCLEMQAYGYRVPPEGRVVYAADYFHGGDPSTH